MHKVTYAVCFCYLQVGAENRVGVIVGWHKVEQFGTDNRYSAEWQRCKPWSIVAAIDTGKVPCAVEEKHPFGFAQAGAQGDKVAAGKVVFFEGSEINI